MSREGPFWDVMEGRAEPPPAAVLLGWQLLSVDPDAGTIEVAFTATEQFVNPVGVVQGGFLAAMLDDTLGPALVATLGPGEFAPTTDLQAALLLSSSCSSGARYGTPSLLRNTAKSHGSTTEGSLRSIQFSSDPSPMVTSSTHGPFAVRRHQTLFWCRATSSASPRHRVSRPAAATWRSQRTRVRGAS
jgi:acyl-coenzyme A thioesterase PaaI-like protein